LGAAAALLVGAVGLAAALLVSLLLDVSLDESLLPQAAVMVSADTTAVVAAILFMVRMCCTFRWLRLECLALWVVRHVGESGWVVSVKKVSSR
jgi:hypothetical protein